LTLPRTCEVTGY